MSDKGSVFQKGGGGTNFEQSIQTAFVTTLIIKGNAPCNFTNEIVEVAFQTTNKGYETDDLFILTKSTSGQHRILAQIKHNITFSIDNEIFNDVIKGFWKDYNKTELFDKEKDLLFIIKSGLTIEDRNHLKSLLNWAKTHTTEKDFVTEVNRIKAKKDRLEVFRESLKNANNSIALTDKELWMFLKCLDVLEYDFLNQNSVDEAYFLNLIRLCKNNDTTANEKEIWAAIYSFVSKLNKDGGSVTQKSIRKEELYKNFDINKLNPYIKAVNKIKSDSEVILKPLKNTIADFHIDRMEINQLVKDSLNSFQFTIVTGKPGVGKSAEVKEVFETEFSSSTIFVFRADQFNEPHLANVFSSQGVNETLQDIFSCISLIPNKIIFIDSLEKLLETNPEYAFKQLLSFIKEYPDIKIIGSSRKYAIDLIIQKFGIDTNKLNIVEVLPLDDIELSSIYGIFPQLESILKNQKIKKILQIPKYLDFAIKALNKTSEDYTTISITEFKEKLWNSLVKDSTNRTKGLPSRREDAFMEIAINRAKEMKLFIKPIKADEEAIELLENDEIIFQEDLKRKYTPSHDILEDWALTKYVSAKHTEYPNPKELFDNLGNEPSIRRAFRLWIEDYLIDDSKKINELLKAAISDVTVEKYWADEVLVAVFKSENCSSFFTSFESEMLSNNASFLNRCLHLIKTSCKEVSPNLNNLSILLPVGSGWAEALLFIRKHLFELDSLRLPICNFLNDWEYRILFQDSPDIIEIHDVKEIVINFIHQIESGDAYWQQDLVRGKASGLISLLYNIANVAKPEITDLIERAFTFKADERVWRSDSFYDNVIEKCLSGIGNKQLITELPKLVVQTAWSEWKFITPENKPNSYDGLGLSRNRLLSNDDCWGINDVHSFFPSGIYKTPLVNLLWYHPLIGLEFITEFLNYSVDFYIHAQCEHKLNFSQIEIELSNGTIIKQWASWELWVAYRGFSVTHYAIESLLMSLEKYLLQTAERKTEMSKTNLKFMFNYLLAKSNNVLITSVLTSVTLAFSEEVEEAMLPILAVKEFYEWDSARALHEFSSLAPQDNKIHFAQEERWNSNQLPHRKKYLRGLGDFIVEYQFNNKKLNNEIHNLFDKLQTKIQEGDLLWKKRLAEIDIRNWEAKEYDEKLGGLVIQPKYEKDVTEFMNSDQDYFTAQSISLNYSSIIIKAFEEKEMMTFQIWLECYKHYSKVENQNILYDRPASLAIIGLRDFVVDLDLKKTKWCNETLVNAIFEILQSTYNGNYSLLGRLNILEKTITLSSFHLLFLSIHKVKERYNLISLMIRMLSAPFSNHESDKIILYICTIFSKSHPDIIKKVWVSLIKYAQYMKVHPYFNYGYDPAKLETAKRMEEKFILALSSSDDLSLNLSEVNFDNYEGSILVKAFVITPYNLNDHLFNDFIKLFIPLITEDLRFQESLSYSQRRQERQIQPSASHSAAFYLSDLIMFSSTQLSNNVVDLLIESLSAPALDNRSIKELNEFISQTFEYLVLKILDLGVLESARAEYDQQIIKFWSTWRYIFEKIKKSNQNILMSTLFFNVRYLLHDTSDKVNEQPWKALESENGIYHEMIIAFSNYNISNYIIELFSSVGEKAFLPHGINWLVEIYKKDPNKTVSLIYPSAERLIKKLYYNHISAIKNDKILIESFIWILNKMVDFGSSEAYLFRENVITYKSTG